ncbi:ribosomal protein L37 [Cardiosporidium cionae]|uniref:Large ribosomal subunit protein mL54 n=1 Tax=Cardiosporidium cionae TaxID=476202 RepID=A0ABQ7J6I8_9APIC|nr:ribosomal protein L37 [Cardiosporidium cionae]|eukprot:KAF8819593.1 ribosomal protein L37 [Cardiosporidium cionae]
MRSSFPFRYFSPFWNRTERYHLLGNSLSKYESTFLNSTKNPWSRLSLCRFLHLSSLFSAPKVKSSKRTADSGTSKTVSDDPTSDHVFNIYSSIKEDHSLLPDEQYPEWLWTLNKPLKTYGELTVMFIHGKGIENAQFEDYRRFRRLHNRSIIKLNNSRLKKSKRGSTKSMLSDV